MQENPLVNFAKFSNQFPYCVYSISNKFKTRNLLFKFIHVIATIITQRSHLAFRYIPLCPVSSTKFRNCAHLNFSRRRETKKPTPSHPFISCTFDLYATELLPPTCSSFHTFVGATFLQFNDPGSEGEGENGFDAFANKLLLNSAGRY